jgi:hypothetical protein
VLTVCVLAPVARAGGPSLAVGTADDAAQQPDYAFAKAYLDKVKLAGLDTIRLTVTWSPGQTVVAPDDVLGAGNAVRAAQFTGVRAVVALVPADPAATPLTDADRAAFARFAADAARRWPYVADFVVGHEPNSDRWWVPQDAGSAGAYVALLAGAYDALKAVRPKARVVGGALAPRELPGTQSPSALLAGMGAAYRASGRAAPVMDALSLHAYPPDSSTAPDLAGAYAATVAALASAFDGTAQPGSALPIVYDELGVESTQPRAEAARYTGGEWPATRPVDVSTQARVYRDALTTAFCQPNVAGVWLSRVQDDGDRTGTQAGQFYADGAPKPSMYAVRDAASAVRRGVVARCPGMQLTPTVTAAVARAFPRGLKVVFTCSLDCAYALTLDGRGAHGRATGGRKTTVRFPALPRSGTHTATVRATAMLNAGPAATATVRSGR